MTMRADEAVTGDGCQCRRLMMAYAGGVGFGCGECWMIRIRRVWC